MKYLELFVGFVLPQLVVMGLIGLLGYVAFRLIKPKVPESKDVRGPRRSRP